MNLYYHPILGLQYTLLGETFIVDIAEIPKGFKVEEFITDWKKYSMESGISFQGSVENYLNVTTKDLN